MRIARPFDPIAPDEADAFGFDFTKDLGLETIASTAWTCAIAGGIGDASPSSRLLGAPQIQGPIVAQKVGTMIAGVVYDLQATVVTSGGRTLSLSGLVLCQSV